MGRNKRKSEETKEKLEKKIRKLQKKLDKHIVSDSDSPDEDLHNLIMTEKQDGNPHVAATDHLEDVQGSELLDISPQGFQPEVEPSVINIVVDGTQNQSSEDVVLDADVLEILGGDSSAKIKMGPPIHSSVANMWTEILTTGLGKEIKADLMKKYLMLAPVNCPLIAAPQLNLEIKAAIPESVIKKDKIHEIKQKQLAAALSSLGQAIDILLKTQESKQVLKAVSDAARILCDHQYFESLTRRHLVLTVLNKTTKDAIQGVKPDEFLFGKDLAERIKACKAVTRSALDLKNKRFNNTNRYSAPSTSQGHTNTYALNWRGPSPGMYRPQGQGPHRGGLQQVRPTQNYKIGRKNYRRL